VISRYHVRLPSNVAFRRDREGVRVKTRPARAVLFPGDVVRSLETGLAGTVMPYGWTPIGGSWQHGPFAPVLWSDGVTTMVGPEHVEVTRPVEPPD
jgi:hypothetical protein